MSAQSQAKYRNNIKEHGKAMLQIPISGQSKADLEFIARCVEKPLAETIEMLIADALPLHIADYEKAVDVWPGIAQHRKPREIV